MGQTKHVSDLLDYSLRRKNTENPWHFAILYRKTLGCWEETSPRNWSKNSFPLGKVTQRKIILCVYKSCTSTHIMQWITLFSVKIYTVGKNFTRPPGVTVATNLNPAWKDKRGETTKKWFSPLHFQMSDDRGSGYFVYPGWQKHQFAGIKILFQ